MPVIFSPSSRLQPHPLQRRLWAPLRLTVRALDLQQQYHLGTGWKCNFSGPISDLLNQKLCVLCCHEPFRPVPTHAGRPQQLPPSPGFTVTSSHPNYQARPRDATQTPVSRRVCDGKECGPLSMRGSASIASPASWEPQVSGREPLPSTRAPRPPLTPFQSKAREVLLSHVSLGRRYCGLTIVAMWGTSLKLCAPRQEAHLSKAVPADRLRRPSSLSDRCRTQAGQAHQLGA
ncbi:uncharacterized protein AAG666_017850 isoform 2-T3 [Megaptera novaeangliae]